MPQGRPTLYTIDFGTSNSLLGAVSAEQSFGLAPLDPEAADVSVMRSLMYFEPGQTPRFGTEAIRHFLDNSMRGRFLRSFKRFLPLKSFEWTLIDGRRWTLEELVARFLREMRERASAHFETDVESVLLGRPALFSEDGEADELAQARLRAAAEKAGFKQIEFLPEPVAAAYRYRLEMEREEIVLVADFGGGTSDYTLIKLSQAPFKPEDVLAIGGAPVAGDALDGAVMSGRVARNFGSEVEYQVPMSRNILRMPKNFVNYLTSTAHINFLNSPENKDFLRRVKSWSLGERDRQAMEQLEILLENQLGFSVFEAIEKTKRALSDQEQSEVSYRYPGVEVREKISRRDYATLTRNEVERIFSALDETLSKAGLRPQDVDRVCCTGGTAKVRRVREELGKRFAPERLENFRNFTSIVEGLNERGQQLLQTA